MSTPNEEYKIVSSHEMQIEVDSQGAPEKKVMSNIPSLDKATDGFVSGELIAISGPTKNGKTLFAQSLTQAFSKQNEFPLWFSFEVTAKYFLRAFPDLPLFYMPRKLKMNALDWVEGKCHESFKQYNTKIIIIDHLHYLVDMAHVRQPSLEIGTIIRRLKLMAVEHGYIIFLLCHTSKGASNGELTYESIRDSSFIAQESDTVFLLQRDMEHPDSNQARLRVEFHRRTGTLRRMITLVKTHEGYLREVETRDYGGRDG
jgi:replicative DNA helicase